MKGYPVVITSDRTMASNYHGNMFFGFSACLPQGVLPDWLFYTLFCPSGKTDSRGALINANCGMRKIEASLLVSGFTRDQVIVAHPDSLSRVVSRETHVLSVSANDPLGIGPATSTYVELWGGRGRMAVKLEELLAHPVLKKYRPTIILGGPGAWQLVVNPEKRKRLGIDCVVVGEGESIAPRLFRQAMERPGSLPAVVEGEIAGDGDIPDIVGGTICGILEATRGCARRCAFCVPSLKKVRSRPLENILREVQVNVRAGNPGIILHGEDILLYGSDGLKVNGPAVVELFSRVSSAPGVKWVTASHASLSSAMSSPETVREISRALGLGTPLHPTKAFQVGIETGSPRLIKRHMRGKVYPFEPAEWPDVVKGAFQLFHSSHIVCCSTLILGLPGEEPDDVHRTLDLVRALRPFQSLIVPLLFSPMETTQLENASPLTKKDLTSDHYALMAACWDHNLSWFPALWANYGRDNHPAIKAAIRLMLKLGTGPLRKRIFRNARKHGARIQELYFS